MKFEKEITVEVSCNIEELLKHTILIRDIIEESKETK